MPKNEGISWVKKEEIIRTNIGIKVINGIASERSDNLTPLQNRIIAKAFKNALIIKTGQKPVSVFTERLFRKNGKKINVPKNHCENPITIGSISFVTFLPVTYFKESKNELKR